MKKWYVVKTKPHRELDVHTLLKKASYESFLPLIRQLHYSKKPQLNLKNLFPNYLFLHIDFSDTTNIHTIKYTRGVSHILCAENKPVPVDDQIIEAIKGKINEQGYIKQPLVVAKGDKIKVRKGLLADLEGIFERKTTDQERVIVLLNLVNYRMKATLHWSEIEKIKT